MKQIKRKLTAVVTICALLAPAAVRAQRHGSRQSQLVYGASNGEVIGIAVGVAAVGAVIGVGTYYAFKHGHSVTGCAGSDADGMTLTSDSDKQTYALAGDVGGIKDGDRVRVSGKKGNKASSGRREFLVEKVSKDFGPCEASTSLH